MLVSDSEQPRPFERVPINPVGEKEDRRIPRISLPLPARVEVKVDPTSNWSEITRLIDVSAFGAGFMLKRPVRRGRMMLLTIPMPRQLRSYDYSEPQYKIWAVSRRCIPTGTSTKNPEYSIGVAFTGKAPPPGHVENPSRLYDIVNRSEEGSHFWNLQPADLVAEDSDLPNELRKETRFDIPESLLIQKIDESGTVSHSEFTVTQNISLSGAAVFTMLKAEAGTFLRVTSERFDTTILAIVRGARVDGNGITRLHLEFIDRHFPLEGIE